MYPQIPETELQVVHQLFLALPSVLFHTIYEGTCYTNLLHIHEGKVESMEWKPDQQKWSNLEAYQIAEPELVAPTA